MLGSFMFLSVSLYVSAYSSENTAYINQSLHRRHGKIMTFDGQRHVAAYRWAYLLIKIIIKMFTIAIQQILCEINLCFVDNFPFFLFVYLFVVDFITDKAFKKPVGSPHFAFVLFRVYLLLYKHKPRSRFHKWISCLWDTAKTTTVSLLRSRISYEIISFNRHQNVTNRNVRLFRHRNHRLQAAGWNNRIGNDRYIAWCIVAG